MPELSSTFSLILRHPIPQGCLQATHYRSINRFYASPRNGGTRPTTERLNLGENVQPATNAHENVSEQGQLQCSSWVVGQFCMNASSFHRIAHLLIMEKTQPSIGKRKHQYLLSKALEVSLTGAVAEKSGSWFLQQYGYRGKLLFSLPIESL